MTQIFRTHSANNFGSTGALQNTATNYTFTISSASVTAGAIYSNNGQLFTALQTIVSGTSLLMNSSGAPSGTTLTLVSGTGPATLTYSAAVNGTSGIATTTNTSATYVPTLTAIITTIGRPVFIGLIGGSSAAQIGLNNTSTSTLNATFKIVRDTVPSTGLVTVSDYILTSVYVGNASPASDRFAPASSIWTVDYSVINTPNTYLYSLQYNISIPSSGTARVENGSLVVFQMEA